jgi:hypothetical protein
MSKILFLVKNYVHKACNPKILNLFHTLKKKRKFRIVGLQAPNKLLISVLLENIVKWINGQRISWLGHLERMEEDRMHKKIFTQELEGTRRRGRPRKG